jgi:hypothetical protein
MTTRDLKRTSMKLILQSTNLAPMPQSTLQTPMYWPAHRRHAAGAPQPIRSTARFLPLRDRAAAPQTHSPRMPEGAA